MPGYDVIIIGGGPGGYVCAIRCSQLGLKVACVEGRGKLGGTCLNVGCIPSKALLHASELYHESVTNFKKLGIKINKPQVDWNQMQSHKNDVITQNTQGIEFLFKKNKVDYIKGWGKIKNSNEVIVNEKSYSTKNIIIATGSEPASLPNMNIDEKQIVSSTGALELKKIPKSLLVIGAGVIGLEMGSVYSRLGSEVTVIEYLDEVTPGLDKETAKTFRKILTKQGIKFLLGAAVTSLEKVSNGIKASYTDNKTSEKKELITDIVLVATGRKPFSQGLDLEENGIKVTDKGQISINKKWHTNIANIYALGDVVEGPMLAHKAEDEGMAVAEIIAGQAGHVNFEVIPGVIYTTPEVASVGKTEEELKVLGKKYKVGKFSFIGNGRAKANLVTDGFVKIISDYQSDRILGAHIIGPAAGDLIHEICVAMEFGASAEDLARTCHAHPTFSEAVREAALALGGGAIHS